MDDKKLLGIVKCVRVKLIIVASLLLVFFFHSGCSYPTIAGPEFTNRNIKTIDICYSERARTYGLYVPPDIAIRFNREVINAVVEALTLKGYSVKQSCTVQLIDQEKHYLENPDRSNPSCIDAVIFVLGDVEYGEPFIVADGTHVNKSTDTIGVLHLEYNVYEPNLKQCILCGLGGGPRKYEMVDWKKDGKLIHVRYRFLETDVDYIRRTVDNSFTNLPRCK